MSGRDPMPRTPSNAGREARTLLMVAALMLGASAPARAQGGGAGEGPDALLEARLPSSQGGPQARSLAAVRGRGALPANSSIVTPIDSFLVMSYGFEDLLGNCNPRGWTAQDLTTRVFAHVSDRFTVNDGFVNMGGRALWFGADSSSASDEIATWARPYGYGNGWSQRLTSPTFSRTSHPGTVLRFDASIGLRRNIDNAGTSVFTPYGLASGVVSNDFLGVQGLKADGSWAFLNGRFSLNSGPAWSSTAPLFVNRVTGAPPLTPTTMQAPTGVAVDDSGNVYVADQLHHRILKFTSIGRFLLSWGSEGDGEGQFQSPRDLAVDAAFNVYVVDLGNRVQKFTNTGAFVSEWGSLGSGPGQLNGPFAIAVDGAGNVLVADTGNHRVQKFTNTGTFLLEWGSFGDGNGEFARTGGVAVDGSGFVYVTDLDNHRIQKFTSSGVFVTAWGSPGSGDGELNGPTGIDVDRDGFIWVADRLNNRIQRFTSVGGFLLETGTQSSLGGHFFFAPAGIACSRNGDLYVAEIGNNRYQHFTLGGPVAGEATFKYEVRLGADGNQALPMAEPLQVRVVMQSNYRVSSQDGLLFAGQEGIILVDNLALQDSLGVDLVPRADFEDGTTGAWTLSALNGGRSAAFNHPSYVADHPPPATSVALRRNFDTSDRSCVWTFLSPGDSLRDGTYARIASPWIGLVPGTTDYVIAATGRLNTLASARFVYVYARGKNAGDATPRAYHSPPFVYFGTPAPNESASPLFHSNLLRFPADILGGFVPVPTDSIQIVFEVLDHPERALGPIPTPRPTARLPILDDVELIQMNVDADYDGVANAFDSCSTGCAAGEDADGDGCIDPTATLHHVESWATADGPIRFRISQDAMPSITDGSDLAAVRDGFDAWVAVDGAAVLLVEDPLTSQRNASGLDGINLVTFQDAEVQFPPGVLALTPTTSFTRRTNFGDRIALPGQIVDSDMLFNPQVAFATPGHPGPFDLRGTTAHEAGHLLGLSHTGVLDATMFFVLQAGQEAASLTEDDRAALAAAYPSATFASFGTITGSVIRGQTGLPLPGALVTAVRLDGSGQPADSTSSDYTREDGTYALRRLVPGSYSVRVTPLDGAVGGFPLTPAHISQRLANIAETGFPAEWWSEPDTDRDDPALRGTIAVAAAQTLTGINVVTTVDTLPPFVVSTLPAAAAAGVSVGTPVLVNFSEPVTTASLQAAFRLRKDGLPPSLGGGGQLLGGMNFVFTPSQGLEFDSIYEIEISPELRDLEGLALADTFRAVFTTQPRPPLAISDIQPRSAPAGALVTITGQGFDPAGTHVSFATCLGCEIEPVPGSSVTATSLVVQVPSQAATGPLTLTTGTETSNPFDFTVLPQQPQVAPVPNGPPVPLTDLSPTDAAVSPDGSIAYAVGNGGFATVDLASETRPVTRHLTDNLRGLALTPDGTRAVICRPSTGEVLVVGASGANLGVPIATVPVGGFPHSAGISPDGRRAYVTDQFAPVIHEIDIEAGSLAAYTLLRDISVFGASLAGGVAVSLDGHKLYASSSNFGLLGIDLTAEPPAVTVENPTPNQGGVAIVPSGGEVLAPGATFSSSLVVIEISPNAPPVPTQIFLGGSPRDVAVTPEGQSALVVNAYTNELQVVDVAAGSATHHQLVSTVGTGVSPLSVGASSLSPVVAVANFGDRTLSIYTTSSADESVERVVPDFALPGDMVAVQTSNDFYTAGSEVDLGSGGFAASYTPGVGVGFVVPEGPQRATTLTLENPSGLRSVALPFHVVDPIASPVPRTPALRVGPGPSGCGAETGSGLMGVARLSPDGRMLAVARNFQICNSFVDLYRVDSGALGARLATVNLGIIADVHDLAFIPDGTRLVVAAATPSLRIVDTDAASPTFGTSLGLFGSPTVGVPFSLAMDPLGRSILVGSEGLSGSPLITFLEITGPLIGDLEVPSIPRALAPTPDGRYLAAALGGRGAIVDLDNRSLVTQTPVHGDPEINLPSSVAVTSDGKRAVAAFSFGDLAVWNLDPGAGAIGAETFYGRSSTARFSQAAPAPDGDGVLLGCSDCDSLFHVEPSTSPPSVSRSFLGQTSAALARSHDGRRLWVTDHDPTGVSGNIRIISLSEATALSLVTGPGQQALAGQPLPLPIRARLTDPSGAPQVGVVVTFELDQETDEGSLDNFRRATLLRRITDVNGEAEVTWKMPATPGPVTLEVSALGVPGTTIVAAEAVANDSEIVPRVIELGPTDGATGVNAGTAVFARFNQRMNTSTLPSFIALTLPGPTDVAGSFSFQDQGRVAIFTPAQPLPFGSACVLTVGAGATDMDGQATAAAASATFTVENPPAPAITAITPPAAGNGATVVIEGEGFETKASNNVVTFNGVLAPVQSATLTSLGVAVPVNATSGVVEVHVGGIASNAFPFTILTPNSTPGQNVGEVPTDAGVSKIAFTPDGARAYVTNPATNSVTVIDVAQAVVLTSLTVGLSPQGIAILPDGSRAYVANTGSDNLSVIDTRPDSPDYNEVVNTIAVGDEPVEVVVSGVGPKVFVANYKSGTVSIIDANSGNATFDQVVTTVNTGSGSSDVSITPEGSRMYVATAAGVVMVDLTSLVVTTVNTGSGASDVSITPEGTLVLALLLNGTLVVIDVVPNSPTFNQVVTTVNTGSGGSDVSITPEGSLAYVTDADGNVVLVFQIIESNQPAAASQLPGPGVTLTLVATIPVGQSPASVAFDPTGSGIGLVPNSGSGGVTVIGFRPLVVVPVEFDCHANSLNLKSLGHWVSGRIRPLPPRLPSEIVISSIRLNGVVPVDPEASTSIEDGVLSVKFLRSAVQLVLSEGDKVPVTVTGTIGGDAFSGTDTVKVKTGTVTAPHPGEAVSPYLPYTLRWIIPNGVQAAWVGILHSLDHGRTWTLDASHVPNTGQASWDPPDVLTDSVKVAVVLVEAASSGDTLVTGVLGASDYFYLTVATDVGPQPTRLELAPVTPTPSVGAARLRYGLPRAARVDLEIFDLLGRRVATLVASRQEAGWHQALWNGGTDGGGRAGGGLYFARLRAEGRTFRQRVIWLR